MRDRGSSRARRARTWRFRLLGIAGNLALLFVSTAVACAVAEVAIRTFAPQPLGLRFYSREGILLHYPGARIREIRPDFESVVSIDSDGLRDREYPPGKPEGGFRILVLGDSYTDGIQVNDDEVWPKQVEALLARAGSRRVELVNAAVAGSGTGDELRYLEVYGPRWQADLVLLAFYCGNDLRDNLSDDKVSFEDGRLEVRHRKPYGWTRFQVKTARAWLGSHSHLYQFVRDRMHPDEIWKTFLVKIGLREAATDAPVEWEDFDDKRVAETPQPPEIERGWELTRALLDRMNEVARSQGSRFAVVVIPSRWMVDTDLITSKMESRPDEERFELDPSLPGRTLEDWAASRGVPALDLYPRFVARGVDRTYHLTVDAHWNPRGHRAAAEEIAAFLERDGLIPGR